MQKLLEALDERVLVCDGAMGTMLYARGVFINKSFDALNITQPDLVAEVHQEYLRAGADIVETNTFGANRIKLGSFGLADKLEVINEQAARIARHAVSAADRAAYVAGAIGPLGIRIEPWGKTGTDEARQYFREQAEALARGGVDLFILETFRDLNEIGAAIDAVRSVSDLPIVAQMTTEEDGNTLDGTPPERFAPELERRGATILGVNCAVGPAPMLETIERMAAVTKLRLSAQPNAGKPRDVEGRNIYLCSPEYMASYARRFILHNVRIVGGCCGTTPEHIRQIKSAVRGLALAAPAPAPGAARRSVPAISAPPVAREQKSRLAHALTRGRFVVAIELLPPRGYQAEQVIERARALKIRGVDVINIPDGQRAGARLSALSLAVLIEQQAGIETLLHYSCRDRNLVGIQSDLLGAHAMGLRNLMLITGDPGRVGDYPDATAVFDVDSIGLTNVVSRLNHGCDVGGRRSARLPRSTSACRSTPARRIWTRSCGGSSTRSKLVRSSSSPAPSSTSARSRPSSNGSNRRVCRSSPACFPSRARATRNSWPTKCRACVSPTPCSTVCAGPAGPKPPRAKESRSRAKSVGN
jgi:methionine synthase I (cobalamin-dependent)